MSETLFTRIFELFQAERAEQDLCHDQESRFLLRYRVPVSVLFCFFVFLAANTIYLSTYTSNQILSAPSLCMQIILC